MPHDDRSIAYFSMEIGLEAAMPTYSGGLGILAGDTVRSAADLQVPMVAVTLLHRKGYFFQRIDGNGWQTESPVNWVVDDFLTDNGARADVSLEGRTVHVRAWRYEARGLGGFVVPVFFLDTDVPENSPWDRTLTDYLYGGDEHYRLCQEVVLGIGGIRMLRQLGFQGIERYHMNEGHASLLTWELLREQAQRSGRSEPTAADVEAVRHQCVFTTHTPVAAGHDQFPLELVNRVLGGHEVLCIKDSVCHASRLNTTFLALTLSHYINGVAKRHGEVSRHMFATYKIDSITNGVHAATWVSRPFARLFDRRIPGWREDNFSLRYALGIPGAEIWDAHSEIKRELVEFINQETNSGFDRDVLTIGFARRAATYKRADLLLEDIERLRALVRRSGRLQVIFAGKAHPRDEDGKRLIQRVFQVARQLERDVPVVYLPNYDMDLARRLTAGVDLWLNTPQPPLEASGTSGMKAAFNGVPSLSVLDGWWIEGCGCIEGVTGWAIGQDGRAEHPPDRAADADALYSQLEQIILPLFYQQRDRYIDVMRHAIALNGSFFNTQRMMQQYVLKAYFG
jgi:starch phosphorylase